MTKESNRSNLALIVIAIIGVCGTAIGATITVIGNINVERIRQETELTRIAMSSNPAQTVQQSPATPANDPGQIVDINSKLDWQNSNIKVEAGDTIIVSYVSGSWSQCAPNGCPYQKAEGILFDGQNENYSLNYADNVIGGCRHASLIARIVGAYSLCIGNGTTTQISETGVLEFRINDIRVEDNDGIVSMLVQIQK